jgi:hypothetical protein
MWRLLQRDVRGVPERVVPREVRREFFVRVVLEFGRTTCDAAIVDLTARGAKIYLGGDGEAAFRPSINQLLVVRVAGHDPIAAELRWIDRSHFGVEFLTAVDSDTLANIADYADRPLQRRPGRAKTNLDVRVLIDGTAAEARMLDLSSGGARISANLAPTPGTAVMLLVDDLMPLWGYVRWAHRREFGLIFTKLLAQDNARILSDRCGLSPAWLADVVAQHHRI